MTARDWLSDWNFYVCGAIYMMARIALNVTATVMPLYLTQTLGFVGERTVDTHFAIAAVPLYAYVCSMLFSIIGQSRIQARFKNRKAPIIFAVFFTTISSIPLLLIEKESWSRQLVYPCACL